MEIRIKSSEVGETRLPNGGSEERCGAAGAAGSGVVLRQILLIGLPLGSAVGIVYFARLVAAIVLFSSIVGSTSISEDRAVNGRGDEATAKTESSGRWRDPDRTVVRLRPAHHWFWTTLVETESFGVRENLKWRSDDELDVTLGFGCLMHMTRAIDKIGSVRISYHFSNGDRTLAAGCPS
jgi:hypothetical protein